MFTKIEVEINPNQEEIVITEHEVVKRFDKCTVVKDTAPGYTWKVYDTIIGQVKDTSTFGGWLEIRMWLKDPTPEELKQAVSDCLLRMDQNIFKKMAEALEYSCKYNRLVQLEPRWPQKENAHG